MKTVYIFFILSMLSCRQQNKNVQNSSRPEDLNKPKEKSSFFPVTDYFKGQISEIKNGNINPLRIVTINDKADSTWLKMEDIETEVKDFLFPIIDSTNLLLLFKESKFMDETLNAVTLTYDPIQSIPDSFPLTHWDVYINPGSGQVKRIYLVKKLAGSKLEQLSWTAGKSCSITTISDDKNGNSHVEKNVTLQWYY